MEFRIKERKLLCFVIYTRLFKAIAEMKCMCARMLGSGE